MKKVIISENQRGLLFKNGRYVKLLSPGKYYTFGARVIEVLSLTEPVSSFRCNVETLINDKNTHDKLAVVDVEDQMLALHYVNGRFSSVLRQGKHAFWSIADKHEFRLVDTSDPIVDESIPEYIFSTISPQLYAKVEVAEHQKARLYVNKKLKRVLDAGTYYFWKTPVKVEVGYVDTRLTRMDVTGQEMLTADKVTVRINFVCNYRVTDYVKIVSEIDNFNEQMHVAAQLALREYVGKYKLDELLESKERMSEFVFDKLKSKEDELFVKFTDAGVKDIIIPGEVRDIMNTVLVAEKKAQANVITRREEVASTRSLLNTAKLMDENKTLYKLKELEYVERICENVGNINLSGNGNILSQLAGILASGTVGES